MRQVINIPELLKQLITKSSKVWHFSESSIICFCVHFTFNYFSKIDYEGFCDSLDDYYHYHIKSLPRGKKARSK